MADRALDHEYWDEPQRDKRGRFRKGTSGNPDGRPPKRSQPPWALEESFARALAEEVAVSGPDGSQQKMLIRDLLVTSTVRDAVKAKGRDKMYIIERLAKLNLLNPRAEEEEDQPIWTDEEHRLIEEIGKRASQLCCQCDKPVQETQWGPGVRDRELGLD